MWLSGQAVYKKSKANLTPLSKKNEYGGFYFRIDLV
jgi:hypothetical protein